MCGLIAVVALRQPKLKVNTSQRVDEGLAEIKHRGPDSQGNWISPNCRVGEYYKFHGDMDAESRR